VSKDVPLHLVFKTIDEATAGMRKIGRNVERFGSKVGKVGKKLTTSLTVPIAAAGALSVKMFADFEQGMSNVATLIDTTTEDLGAMSDRVLQLGREIPAGLGEMTQALFDIRSAGRTAGEQFTVLEGSAKLGVAALGTTQQAAKVANAAINSWRLEGDEAADVYNVLFKTAKNGVTTMAELSQGFGGVSGMAATAGIKFDEFAAATAALTKTGLKASEAYTQQKAIIAGLTRSTSLSRAVFRKLGAKDFPDLIEKSGGFQKALVRIDGALKGNDSKILKLVGSTEALSAVQALTRTQADTFTDTLDNMRDGADDLGVAFDKQSKTTASRMKIMRNSIQATAISIGNTLLPIVDSMIKKLESAAKWFAGLSEESREWILILAGVAAAAGPVISVIGGIAKGIGFAIKAIVAFKKAWAVVSAAMAANPIGAALILMTTAAGMIIAEWDEISDFFRLLWHELGEIFDAGVEWIEKAVDKLLRLAKRAIGAVGDVMEFLNPFDEDEEFKDSAGPRPSEVLAAQRAARQAQTVPIETGQLFGPQLPPELAGTALARSKVEIEIKGDTSKVRASIDPTSEGEIEMTTGFQPATP
jgi:TP901 family phage tail tape measure protein